MQDGTSSAWLGIRELAKRASISATTVTRFENGVAQPNKVTLLSMERALTDAGVEFTNGEAPGVRLRRKEV